MTTIHTDAIVDTSETVEDRDSGASTVEVLSWAAMSVVAIVAIGGALQALGLDVIAYIQGQLGV